MQSQGKERDESVRAGENLEDAAVLTLRMEGKVMSQGIRLDTESRYWKKQGCRFSSRTSRRNTALLKHWF